MAQRWCAHKVGPDVLKAYLPGKNLPIKVAAAVTTVMVADSMCVDVVTNSIGPVPMLLVLLLRLLRRNQRQRQGEQGSSKASVFWLDDLPLEVGFRFPVTSLSCAGHGLLLLGRVEGGLGQTSSKTANLGQRREG